MHWVCLRVQVVGVNEELDLDYILRWERRVGAWGPFFSKT